LDSTVYLVGSSCLDHPEVLSLTPSGSRLAEWLCSILTLLVTLCQAPDADRPRIFFKVQGREV
jgi:hypothetical protein